MGIDLYELIKENPDINITVKAEDLKAFALWVAKSTAKAVLNNHHERLFTRKETIEEFQVCSATLWRWNKLGLIRSRKIGGRQYFSESEIKRLTKK